MGAFNPWYPAINSKGEVASGSGEIFVARSPEDWQAGRAVSLGVGWRPVWVYDDVLLYNGDTATILYDWAARKEMRRFTPAYDNLSGEGGAFSGLWAGSPITLIQGVLDRATGTFTASTWTSGDAGKSAVFGDRRIRTNHYNDPTHEVIVGTTTVYTGAVLSVSICAGAWCATVGEPRQTIGGRGTDSGKNVSVSWWEDSIVVDGPDGPWILSTTQTGMILRPFGATRGYRWDGAFFAPAIRWMADHFVIVSRDADNHPILTQVMDLSDAERVELQTTTPPPVVVEPDDPPQTADSVGAYHRKVWIAPYHSYGQYGLDPIPGYTTYANAALIVTDPRDLTTLQRYVDTVYPLGHPLIVQGDVPAFDDSKSIGSIVAWWASGASPTTLGASVDACRKRKNERPIVAYLDMDNWPSAKPTWVGQDVWPGIQAYRKAGETVAKFADRMEDVCETVTDYAPYIYLALTPRFDDVNGTQSVDFTLECMTVYAELMFRFPICMINPFADRRGQGIAHYLTLKYWAQAFADANPDRPNRYDYWASMRQDPKAAMVSALRNKLGQTVEMTMLSMPEKQFLLTLLNK